MERVEGWKEWADKMLDYLRGIDSRKAWEFEMSKTKIEEQMKLQEEKRKLKEYTLYGAIRQPDEDMRGQKMMPKKVMVPSTLMKQAEMIIKDDPYVDDDPPTEYPKFYATTGSMGKIPIKAEGEEMYPDSSYGYEASTRELAREVPEQEQPPPRYVVQQKEGRDEDDILGPHPLM